MTNYTGPPNQVTTPSVTVKTLPISIGAGSSLLDLNHTNTLSFSTSESLLAVKTSCGRWYRDEQKFVPADSNLPPTVGTPHPLTHEETELIIELGHALKRGREPIGSAVVERTSVFLEQDSTISIVATIQNTTGRWLFGRGSHGSFEDSLGVRFLNSGGIFITERRVHFHFQLIPPGGSITVRGSIPWSDLDLSPGHCIVVLDVVRDGVNWSLPILSAPKHPLIIPDTIYSTSPEIARFPTMKRLLTLTFNAHRNDLYTAELLDMLGMMGVAGTFFVSGYFMEHFPYLVRRMVDEGHDVGNFTDSVPLLAVPGHNLLLPSVTPKSIQDELERAEEKFSSLIGQNLHKIWRSPHGVRNGPILQVGGELGYRHILWTLDSNDSQVSSDSINPYTMEQVAVCVEEFIETPKARGGIILFNAGSNDIQYPLYDTIQRIIERAWARGFSFRTVGEMEESSTK